MSASRPAPAAAPAGTAHHAPWRLVQLPETFGVQAVEATHGVLTGFLGAVRVRVEHDRATYARSFPGACFVAGVATADGWRFLTDDGALYHAPEFLGDLSLLDETHDATFLRPLSARGVLAAADTRGDLWFGADRLRRSAEFPPGGVLSAVFLSALHGAVVAAPGVLFETVDGGASFTRRPAGVVPLVEAVVVRGSLAVRPVFAAPQQAHDAMRAATPFDAELRRALRALPAAPDPATRIASLSLSARLLSDGSQVAQHGSAVMLFPAEGAASIEQLPEPRCAPVAFGSQLVEACGDDDRSAGALRVFLRTGVERWRLLGDVDATSWHVEQAEALRSSDDGRELLALGRCAGSPEPAPGALPLCWFDGAAWRSRSLGERPGTPRLLAHGRLLYSRASAEGANWVIADLRSEPVATVDLIPPVRRRLLVSMEAEHALVARFASETLLAVRARGARRLELLHLDDDGTERRVQVPEGATRVGFATATHGAALGDSRDAVWTTEDGGAAWRAHALAGTSPGAATPFTCRHVAPESLSPGPTIDCNAAGCVARELFVWAPARNVAWADALPPPVGRRSALAPAPAPITPAASASLRCTLPERVTAPTGTPARVVEVSTGEGAWLECTMAAPREGAGRAPITLRWGSADSLGPFEVQTSVPAGAARGLIHHDPRARGASSRVLLATRDRVLVVVSPGYVPGERLLSSTLLLVSREGAAHSIDLARASYFGLRADTVAEALPLPSGGVALYWPQVVDRRTNTDLEDSSDSGPARPVDVVAHIGPTGRLMAFRGYVLDETQSPPGALPSGYRALAVGADGPALALLPRDEGAPVVLYPVDRTRPPTSLPLELQAAPPLCAGPSPATTAVAMLRAYPPHPRARFGPGGDERSGPEGNPGLLEWSNGAACVRGLRPTWHATDHALPPGTPALSIEAGQLHAWWLGPDVRSELPCAAAPSPGSSR